eukprot:scaffold289058_cov31-Tisochrysis_lutea.AAC.5
MAASPGRPIFFLKDLWNVAGHRGAASTQWTHHALIGRQMFHMKMHVLPSFRISSTVSRAKSPNK